MCHRRVWRSLFLLSCLTLAVCLQGCDVVSLEIEESNEAASSFGLQSEDLPTRQTDNEPEPVAPPTPVVESGPDPLVLAAELLPPSADGMPATVARGKIVIRLLDCHRTAAGITSKIAVVNVGDEEIQTVLDTGSMVESPRHRQESVLLVSEGQRIPGRELAVTLIPRIPVTIQTLWLNLPNRPLGNIETLQVGIADAESPAIFRRPPVHEPRPEETTADEIDATFQLLREFCTGVEGSMAYWQKNQTTGRVAVRLTEFAPDTESLAGEFFLPGEPRAVKQFTGTISADGRTGSLKTVKRSGMRGRPTLEPSTLNLLLSGSEAEYSMRFTGHELYGESENGFRLCITTVPVGTE